MFDPGGFSSWLSLVLASLQWVKSGCGDLSVPGSAPEAGGGCSRAGTSSAS